MNCVIKNQIILFTSSTWCFTNINSHGMFPPYLFMLSLKTVIYISPIIYQFCDGTLNKYLATWNIWASTIIYFRLQKSKLWYFGHWHQREISWGNVGRGSQCGPCQSGTRGIGEVSSHVGEEVLGATRRNWSHSEGGARVKTSTSGNYHKTPFLRESIREHQLYGWKT